MMIMVHMYLCAGGVGHSRLNVLWTPARGLAVLLLYVRFSTEIYVKLAPSLGRSSQLVPNVEMSRENCCQT